MYMLAYAYKISHFFPLPLFSFQFLPSLMTGKVFEVLPILISAILLGECCVCGVHTVQ